MAKIEEMLINLNSDFHLYVKLESVSFSAEFQFLS